MERTRSSGGPAISDASPHVSVDPPAPSSVPDRIAVQSVAYCTPAQKTADDKSREALAIVEKAAGWLSLQAAQPSSAADKVAKWEEELRDKKHCVCCGSLATNACSKCLDLTLANPAYYCSRECQKSHWPTHKRWHKEQQVILARGLYMDGEKGRPGVLPLWKEFGNPNEQLVAEGCELLDKQQYSKAVKKLKRAIAVDAAPTYQYNCLAEAYGRSGQQARALECLLEAVARGFPHGNGCWECSAACAFTLLTAARNKCTRVQKPTWFNDAALKEMSKHAVTQNPDHADSWQMRGSVLSGVDRNGEAPEWAAECPERTSAELFEAAECYRKAAELCPPDNKSLMLGNATRLEEDARKFESAEKSRRVLQLLADSLGLDASLEAGANECDDRICFRLPASLRSTSVADARAIDRSQCVT